MNVVVEETFQKLYGLPSWGVKQGYGSFLTFEFGPPFLRVEEVRLHAARPQFPATRSRQAHVHGEWHLWIYCCSWIIQQEGEFTAHSESSRDVIQVACNVLNGQALTSVDIVPMTGETEFTFDLGGALRTTGEGYERSYTSWMLRRPDRVTFSYRHDGHYSLSPESDSWKPIWDA